MSEQMLEQMSQRPGFIAALDQSGGSTPKALAGYGVPEDSWSSEAEMFALIHQMRVRIMTAPAFTGERVLATILFEQTMDGEVEGAPAPTYLWRERGIVPIVKVDQGLAEEADGVQTMKPMPGLDDLLDRAVGLGVFGTKMRSVVQHASRSGIAAVVGQQLEIGEHISTYGLVPILEPEVSIDAPDKAEAEGMLLDELRAGLDALPAGRQVMLKLSIPTIPDLYRPLVEHDRVMRVVALSGGYSRDEACERLAHDHAMIASFSRALISDLRRDMGQEEFDAALAAAVEQIYAASTEKS
ncbi:fructose bisphosphate aldolase [Nocardioides mangrovicus]|uniref:fructose-bisphosphate aldolase n=1 Tax=Nocardioides mangrovicus TaxID=2478913 RepID=A0A3L8P611_9ACTN|nr:fructose bisphosphate aldolase [Nocardioides mangrovicus]